MFVACGIWCLADVSSVSPSSELFAFSLDHLTTTYAVSSRTARPNRSSLYHLTVFVFLVVTAAHKTLFKLS